MMKKLIIRQVLGTLAMAFTIPAAASGGSSITCELRTFENGQWSSLTAEHTNRLAQNPDGSTSNVLEYRNNEKKMAGAAALVFDKGEIVSVTLDVFMNSIKVTDRIHGYSYSGEDLAPGKVINGNALIGDAQTNIRCVIGG